MHALRAPGGLVRGGWDGVEGGGGGVGGVMGIRLGGGVEVKGQGG